MKFIQLLCFLTATAILSSCAAYRAQNCSENAGYEKGMNDAKMGRLMAMGQFAAMCPGGDVEAAQRGYKAGFEAGTVTLENRNSISRLKKARLVWRELINVT